VIQFLIDLALAIAPGLILWLPSVYAEATAVPIIVGGPYRRRKPRPMPGNVIVVDFKNCRRSVR